MLYALKVLAVIDVLLIAGLLFFQWALAGRARDIVTPKIIALVLLTPAIALFSSNYYLFLIYLAATIVVSASTRNQAAGTYLVLLPLMPILSQETGAGGIYFLALSTALALGLGALIAFFIAGGRRKSVTMQKYDLAMLALVVLFTFIYNHNPSATSLLRSLTAYILGLAGPYLLVSRGIPDRVALERLLLQLLLGATLTSITACFQAGWHWVLFEQYYGMLHVRSPVGSFALSMRAGLLRTGGAMNDYSAGGLYLAGMVTLFALLRHRFTALGFWAVLGVLVVGLFATQSRGGWLAAIVGVVIVAAIRGKWGRVLILGGTALALEVIVLLFVRTGRLADMLGRGEATGNVTYRQDLLSEGIVQIKAHPLFGQSQTDLIANMASLRQGEGIVDFVNGHLFVAMAAGVPVFLLWVAIWGMPVVDSWRTYRKTKSNLAVVPAAIVVPVMTALTFTSISDRNLHWAVIALAVSAACYRAAEAPVRRSARRLDPRPPVASAAPSPIAVPAG